MALITVAVPAARAADTPRVGGTYRASLRLSPQSLDPAQGASVYAVGILQQIFDGLVEYDADLQIQPALAEGWRVSVDGRTYTFRLRSGVRFHHGRAVSVDDVVYSLTRVLRPETGSDVASLFEVIEGAQEVRSGKTDRVRGLRALGPREVEIRLQEPYAPFLALLATRGGKVVPKDIVEGGGRFGEHPVGTGPFRFVRWEPGREIVLEANPDYFRGRPYLDLLIYRIHPEQTETERFEQLRRGELEQAALPAAYRAEVEREKGRYQVRRRPLLSIQFYGFQLGLPQWRDRRVREALLVAVDRSALIEKTPEALTPARGILPPGLPGYQPGPPVPAADPVRAARLLAEAGHPGGKGLPPIAVWSAIRGTGAETEMTRMREAWTALGLNVSLNFAPDWPVFTRMLAERRLPLFRYGWWADIPDPDNVLGILFHSRSAYNRTGYANPEVDRLLEQARRDQDPISRARLYADIERRILADVPVIPVAHLWFEVVYQPYVRGVEVSALGRPYIPMRKVWLARP